MVLIEVSFEKKIGSLIDILNFKPSTLSIYIGTIGFFMVLFLLYSRTFPVIAQAELKTILKSSSDTYKNQK